MSLRVHVLVGRVLWDSLSFMLKTVYRATYGQSSSTVKSQFNLSTTPGEYRITALVRLWIRCLQFPEPVAKCRQGDPILQAPVLAGQTAFLESPDPFCPEIRFGSYIIIHTKHLQIFETSISDIWRNSQTRIITYLHIILCNIKNPLYERNFFIVCAEVFLYSHLFVKKFKINADIWEKKHIVPFAFQFKIEILNINRIRRKNYGTDT